jgi:hypothetical protein
METAWADPWHTRPGLAGRAAAGCGAAHPGAAIPRRLAPAALPKVRRQRCPLRSPAVDRRGCHAGGREQEEGREQRAAELGGPGQCAGHAQMLDARHSWPRTFHRRVAGSHTRLATTRPATPAIRLCWTPRAAAAPAPRSPPGPRCPPRRAQTAGQAPTAAHRQAPKAPRCSRIGDCPAHPTAFPPTKSQPRRRQVQDDLVGDGGCPGSNLRSGHQAEGQAAAVRRGGQGLSRADVMRRFNIPANCTVARRPVGLGSDQAGDRQL